MVSALILCAGASSRMGGTNKQLCTLGGLPVFVQSCLKFERCADIGEIILAVPAGQAESFRRTAESCGVTKLSAVAEGGASRFLSVKNALAAVSESADVIAVHDGARPLTEPCDISRVVADARAYGASIAAAPACDTIKLAEGGSVASTIPRGSVYLAQTPQAFSKRLYLQCAERLGAQAEELTDDSQLFERCGLAVHITEITRPNLKITRPADLSAARAAFGEDTPMIRTGCGYDVHRLCEGRRLVLCGAEIPSPLGLLGHSDADVAVHALMDAVLGALALGDIGKLFPDSDPAYKGADSMKLLAQVIARMESAGYSLGNLDITIIAEKPKLAAFIPQMRENLAGAFGCDIGRVSVKATTEEGLGLAGAGIGAHASVLLVKTAV